MSIRYFAPKRFGGIPKIVKFDDNYLIDVQIFQAYFNKLEYFLISNFIAWQENFLNAVKGGGTSPSSCH